MSTMVSQITSLTIVCPTICSDAGQRKHQSSASLAFLRRIHRWPVNSQHKWPVTRKMFPSDDVIMKLHTREYMPQNTYHDKSTLVQVMSWCHQATSHYLSQWWPGSMSPYGVRMQQRVNAGFETLIKLSCNENLITTYNPQTTVRPCNYALRVELCFVLANALRYKSQTVCICLGCTVS